HVLLADRADAAALPDVSHALVELARPQPEPGLPRGAYPHGRRDLENAADVEHNRLNRHARIIRLPPGARSTSDRAKGQKLAERGRTEKIVDTCTRYNVHRYPPSFGIPVWCSQLPGPGRRPRDHGGHCYL